ncbi:hypothetical protein [Lentilactobacillus kisonensis]|uniref:hypothetical protein n=1 Tax=Lentilactobacillus kisonensis TaxID=481722 RepID=UPI00030F879A|nr:hypothetical protein [Lentilactobacillus kisonensis]
MVYYGKIVETSFHEDWYSVHDTLPYFAYVDVFYNIAHRMELFHGNQDDHNNA